MKIILIFIFINFIPLANELQSKEETNNSKLMNVFSKKDASFLEEACIKKIDYVFTIIDGVNSINKEKSITNLKSKYILDQHAFHFDIKILTEKYNNKKSKAYFDELLKITKKYNIDPLNKCMIDTYRVLMARQECLKSANTADKKKSCEDGFKIADENILGLFFSKK